MTERPSVTVRYRDPALRAVIGHVAREVDGVVELQRRARAAVRRTERSVPGVDLRRSGDGSLDVTVLVVCRLHPTPMSVIARVGAAVERALDQAGHPQARVEVVVTDIRAAARSGLS